MNKPFFFQVAVKDFKAAGDGAAEVVKITGLASTPGIDRYGDIVEPEAFAKALDRFMKNPVLLRSHDSDRPCGTVTKATVTGDGLQIEADVIDAQTATEVKDGRMRALSIGYIPLFTILKWKNEDGTIRDFNSESDSYWSPNCIRVIKELDLVEISIVSTPANAEALFSLAKSLKAQRETLSVKDMNAMLAAGTKETKSTEAAEAAKAETSTGQDAAADGAGADGKDAAATGSDAGAEGADADAGAAGTGDEAASADTAGKGEADADKGEGKDAGDGSSAAADDAGSDAAGAEAGKDAETATKTEGADAGLTPEAGDEAEKAAETAAAAAGAGEAGTQDKDAGADAGADGEGKRVAVARDVIEASKDIEGLLKELGIIADDTAEGAAATKLPDEVKDLVTGLLAHIVEQNKQLDEAEAKLAKIPAKQALAPAAQVGEPAKAKPGDFLKALGIPLGTPSTTGK